MPRCPFPLQQFNVAGTILVLVVYFLSNLALPFYYRRYRPAEFSTVKHVILPILGARPRAGGAGRLDRGRRVIRTGPT